MTVQNDTEIAKNHPAPATNKTNVSAAQIVLIGLAVLGAVALASYQFFFCAGCYG